MDTERVTKRFYERFSTELTAFGRFIDGITTGRPRLVGIPDAQPHDVRLLRPEAGFLNEDPDYLLNKLGEVQSKHGGDRFQQFYRIFLLKLFHKGLGQPEAQRSSEVVALLGKVLFLNGGLFDVHDLERHKRINPTDADARLMKGRQRVSWLATMPRLWSHA